MRAMTEEVPGESARPLSGIRVIDLTLAMAGPLATQRLADLGAEVVKIEGPKRPDFTRQAPMADVWLGGETMAYLSLNRGKRSLALDLKTEKGREAIYRLVKTCDVVVQNFRPGVAERLGIDYAKLTRVRPDIIYLSLSGYGDSGPMVNRPGQDLLVQCFAGLTWHAGVIDGPPHPSPVYMIDVMASHLAAQGVLAAIVQRERTGRGAMVSTSLLAAALEVQIQELSTFLTTGREPARSEHPYASIWMEPPYGIYRTADGWIAIAQSSLADIADVLATPGLRQVAAERPADPKDRQAMTAWRDRIYPVVSQALISRQTEDAVAVLTKAGIWSGPVNDLRAVASHPQTAGFFMSYDHPTAGRITTTAPSIRFSDGPPAELSGAPALGADTEEILQDLGYSQIEIGNMRTRGEVL